MPSQRAFDPPEVAERYELHSGLALAVAKQVQRTCAGELELEELMSFAREGLLDAARRFDASRGVPFPAYARLRIRGAVIDGVRALSTLPRRVHERLRAAEAALRYSEGLAEDVLSQSGHSPAVSEQALNEHLAGMATAIAMGLVARTALEGEERIAVSQGADPESSVERAELVAKIRLAIEGLPEQEAELVRRHYLEGERFDHVATDLGLSKSWSSRLHTRALQRLSKRLSGLEP